jgi:hypothetical protein
MRRLFSPTAVTHNNTLPETIFAPQQKRRIWEEGEERWKEIRERGFEKIERGAVARLREHGIGYEGRVGSERAIGKCGAAVSLAGNWCRVEKRKSDHSSEAIAC